MRKLLNKISSDEVMEEAAIILKAAYSSQIMGTKYSLYNEANDLKKIAKILWKYEEMTTRGDY